MRGVWLGAGIVVAAAAAWWLLRPAPPGGDAPAATADVTTPVPLPSTPVVAPSDVQRGKAATPPADLPVAVPPGWTANAVLDTPGAAFLTLRATGATDGQADAAAMMAAVGCAQTPVQQGPSLVWACPPGARGDGLQLTLTPGEPTTMSLVWRRRTGP